MCTHYMGFSRLALIATICCNNCVRTLLCHQSKITRFYRYLRTDFNNFDQYIAQDKLNLSSYSVVLSPFTKYYTVFRLPSKRLLWTKYYWLFAYKWCFKFCSIGINKSEEFPAHRPPSCNQQRWSALGCKPIHALSLSPLNSFFTMNPRYVFIAQNTHSRYLVWKRLSLIFCRSE